MKNEMRLDFDATASNEGLARVAVAAFVSCLNPTLEEIADIKTAVSEAVTNAIIHGYGNLYGYGVHDEACQERHDGKVFLHCLLEDDNLLVTVKDEGRGIENIEKAMEPLYTTRPELERSGMGFSFMEAFMDELDVQSTVGKGTVIHMKKKLNRDPELAGEA